VQSHLVKISREGRVLIPVAVRTELGLSEGSSLNLIIENGEIRLFDRDHALIRARKAVERLKKSAHSVVQELIADRRQASKKE
jgi:AbrB family looped-hinge helix DNA binding protein